MRKEYVDEPVQEAVAHDAYPVQPQQFPDIAEALLQSSENHLAAIQSVMALVKQPEKAMAKSIDIFVVRRDSEGRPSQYKIKINEA